MMDMSDTEKMDIKAADLNRRHLGRTVRVTQWASQITGMLSGVSHSAALIDESRIGQEVPTFVIGPTVTTLTFMYAGEMQVDGNADVEVSR